MAPEIQRLPKVNSCGVFFHFLNFQLSFYKINKMKYVGQGIQERIK